MYKYKHLFICDPGFSYDKMPPKFGKKVEKKLPPNMESSKVNT